MTCILLGLLLACTREPGTVPKSATGETGTESPSSPPTGPTGDTAVAPTTPPTPTEPTSPVEPPLGGTSGGTGGQDHPSPVAAVAGSSDYVLLAPAGSAAGSAVPLLLVFSGTEGADLMAQNLVGVGPAFGLGDAVVAVLDGRSSGPTDGEAVLDEVRAAYDIDNDRTWLLSESAGTTAGLELGLSLRPMAFAAYWANDVNASRTPDLDAAALGFEPWGNAGPGGDFADAEAIVEGMRAAGYRLPADAPYSGPGAGTHGATQQFLAAAGFFADKRRE